MSREEQLSFTRMNSVSNTIEDKIEKLSVDTKVALDNRTEEIYKNTNDKLSDICKKCESISSDIDDVYDLLSETANDIEDYKDTILKEIKDTRDKIINTIAISLVAMSATFVLIAGIASFALLSS